MRAKWIDEIHVENVKGLDTKTFQVQVLPNRANILVAPNGTGKSSVTAAFAALNKNRLDLPEDHFRNEDENLAPKLRIRYTDDHNASTTVEADRTSNSIAPEFDVFVINSQLISKAKLLKFGGKSVAKSAIQVDPIVLGKVPVTAKLAYSYANAKSTFGANGKVLPNITSLVADASLIADFGRSVIFDKATQQGAQKPLQALRSAINTLQGPATSVAANLPHSVLAQAMAVPHIAQLIDALRRHPGGLVSDLEFCLAALQFSELWLANKPHAKAAAEYSQFLEDKAGYEQLFQNVKSTWKNVRPKIAKGQLVLELPRASQISNGERDVIVFIGQLIRARLRLRKEKCLLVIDEIFDYLDDANLIACQFYLSTMMEEMKADQRQLFPIIFTHLNPVYFRTFVFKKMNVRYLEKVTVVSRVVEKLIVLRDDTSIEAAVSKAYLHYDPTPVSLTAQFAALKLDPSIADSSLFAQHVHNQLSRYKAGQTYDPIAVCCAVRLEVERLAYSQLQPPDQTAFLSTHTTRDKLEFAESKGGNVPEVHFLLGVIYNEAAHLKNNRDNFSPLSSKLEHRTIKQMIKSSV